MTAPAPPLARTVVLTDDGTMAWTVDLAGFDGTIPRLTLATARVSMHVLTASVIGASVALAPIHAALSMGAVLDHLDDEIAAVQAALDAFGDQVAADEATNAALSTANAAGAAQNAQLDADVDALDDQATADAATITALRAHVAALAAALAALLPPPPARTAFWADPFWTRSTFWSDAA